MHRLIRVTIPAERAGSVVLDFLSTRFTYHSQIEWMGRMADGRITVNGIRATPDQVLAAVDVLAYDASDIPEPPMDNRIALVHVDADLVVVNKSGNLTCHPCGRYFNHTLWALLKTRHGVENPIFVNRIDRETSGLVVVARTPEAAKNLRAQFAGRTVQKRYLALVEGAFPAFCAAAGWIVADYTGEVLKKRKFVRVDVPDADSCSRDRWSRAAVIDRGYSGAETAKSIDTSVGEAPEADAQWAVTDFRLCTALGDLSLIEAFPHTGRLHQIRVTLQTLGFPLVGDKLYGVDPGFFVRFCKDELTGPDRERMRINRQALHAAGLRFQHPSTGRDLAFDLPLPEDMQQVIATATSRVNIAE